MFREKANVFQKYKVRLRPVSCLKECHDLKHLHGFGLSMYNTNSTRRTDEGIWW